MQPIREKPPAHQVREVEIKADPVLAIIPDMIEFPFAENAWEPTTFRPKISPVFLVSPKFRKEQKQTFFQGNYHGHNRR